MSMLIRIYYCFLLTIFATIANAQTIDTSLVTKPGLSLNKDSASRVQIRKIFIQGNKRTKFYIILREIQFKEGDYLIIKDLHNALQQARQQVYNTTLFSDVKIEPVIISASDIDVMVTVKERWYIFPTPQFQLVDRSLNEWLVKYKGDLSRVNYGIKFLHYNLSGRKDPLRLYLINGYTRNVSFSYSQPYSNVSLTQGFNLSGGFSQNREIIYKTSPNNKLQFYKTGNFVRNTTFASVGYRIQKAILDKHIFNFTYTHIKVNDSVVTTTYNPNYLNVPGNSKGFLDLSYTYQYVNVNNIFYPLKGITGFATVAKRGWGLRGGINMFSLHGAYNKYWDLTRNWYGSFQVMGMIKLPFEQPFINQQALGYGEAYLRGLEYYSVDGVAYGIGRSSLKKKLISFSLPFPFKSKTHTNIPFTIFAKTFADAGFSYNKKKYDTYLNNRFLYTGGIGIDVLTFYDLVLRIEYSFNQLGENGIFLHTKIGF